MNSRNFTSVPPAARGLSEFPSVNKALGALQRSMEKGELDAVEASDLADRVWDSHNPSSAEKIVANYLNIKRFLARGELSETLAQKLFEMNFHRPAAVQVELDVFKRLREKDIPAELAKKIKVLDPSASYRLLNAMTYIRGMVDELMRQGLLDEEKKARLQAKDTLLAELELRLSIPKDVDFADTEQVQKIREKLDYWLVPSDWPLSEIPE